MPGEANPISGTPMEIEDLTLTRQITDDDFFCGAVSGMLTEPIPLALDGSTFGTVRIVAGTEGMALPAPVADCPVSP